MGVFSFELERRFEGILTKVGENTAVAGTMHIMVSLLLVKFRIQLVQIIILRLQIIMFISLLSPRKKNLMSMWAFSI